MKSQANPIDPKRDLSWSSHRSLRSAQMSQITLEQEQVSCKDMILWIVEPLLLEDAGAGWLMTIAGYSSISLIWDWLGMTMSHTGGFDCGTGVGWYVHVITKSWLGTASIQLLKACDKVPLHLGLAKVLSLWSSTCSPEGIYSPLLLWALLLHTCYIEMLSTFISFLPLCFEELVFYCSLFSKLR